MISIMVIIMLGRTPGYDQHSHPLEGVKVLDVDATMRLTGATCSQDIQECFNLHKRFSRLLQPIKHNPKQSKKGERMRIQIAGKALLDSGTSTTFDDGVTPCAGPVHAYNAKLHHLLNLCSSPKPLCCFHAMLLMDRFQDEERYVLSIQC